MMAPIYKPFEEGSWEINWNTLSTFTNNSRTTDVTLESLLQVKKEMDGIMKRKVIKMDTNTPPEPVFTEEQMVFHRNFEEDIIKNLFDDTYKLIFADWLEDQEQEGYSKLVRFAVEERVWPYSWVEKKNDTKDSKNYEEIYSWWSRNKGYTYTLSKMKDLCDIGTVLFKLLKSWVNFEDERRGYLSLYRALWDYKQAKQTHWDGLTLFDRLEKSEEDNRGFDYGGPISNYD